MKRTALTLMMVTVLIAPLQAQTIKRQEIINNAVTFMNLKWKMNARNIQGQCYSPIWINTHFPAGANVTGMAYCWGGGHTISEFNKGIADSGRAGNRCTKQQGNDKGYRSNTFGVDCSGLVTRAWGLSNIKHLGTGELGGYSTSFTSQLAMRMGDIFNQPGEHTAIFWYETSAGKPHVIEASAADWKVSERDYEWRYFKNYTKMRYNQLQDGGAAKLNAGISINPLTVRKGKSISVIFHLKELEGLPITYDTVTCAILDSSNRFMGDLTWVNNFKVPANGEKSYSVASAVINLPPGTYKAVARGKVTDWFDFQTTGSGVNGKTFTVVK